jgi:hypothetical protein
MKKRLIVLFTFTVGLLIFLLSFSGQHRSVEAKEKTPTAKIGVIDLSLIKKNAPAFVRLEEQAEANRQLLADYTARVLAEHQQQIKALSPNDYEQSQEMALAVQAQIDQKRRELEENYRQEEAAVMEEFEAVLAKVVKDKRLDCLLLKDGFQVGGEDMTEKVMKTWDTWGLNFWQRVFGGKKARSK